MKKIISLTLACALVITSLTACSSEEISGVIQNVGSQVYYAVENGGEIKSAVTDLIENNQLESVVTDIVSTQLESVAAVASAELEGVADTANGQIESLSDQAGSMIDDVEAVAINKIEEVQIPENAGTVIEAAVNDIADMVDSNTVTVTVTENKDDDRLDINVATAVETDADTSAETDANIVKETDTVAEAAKTETKKLATAPETEKAEEKKEEAEKEAKKEGTETVTKEAAESEKNLSDDASGFVMVNEVADKIIQDMRYYSLYNELRLRLPGYEQPALLLTKEAAEAIKKASDALYEDGYILKIYDAYRPKKAQEKLDAEGMGSVLADHPRGSSVDVTLVDRKTGRELDMSGCAYGFINRENIALSETQKSNQKLLKKAMEKAGFMAGDEWFHFVLKDEPYKDTYFTFPINFKVAGKTAEEYRKTTDDVNKDRKLRFIIELYDDGSVEWKPGQETADEGKEK